jgi:hypothetical protein
VHTPSSQLSHTSAQIGTTGPSRTPHVASVPEPPLLEPPLLEPPLLEPPLLEPPVLAPPVPAPFVPALGVPPLAFKLVPPPLLMPVAAPPVAGAVSGGFVVPPVALGLVPLVAGSSTDFEPAAPDVARPAELTLPPVAFRVPLEPPTPFTFAVPPVLSTDARPAAAPSSSALWPLAPPLALAVALSRSTG